MAMGDVQLRMCMAFKVDVDLRMKFAQDAVRSTNESSSGRLSLEDVVDFAVAASNCFPPCEIPIPKSMPSRIGQLIVCGL